MTYANIIFKYGVKKFIKKARQVGVEGVIIPDIPVDNDEDLNEVCKSNDIANILIAAPGTTSERIKKLSQKGSGFLYTVTRRGITGKRQEINKETQDWLKLVKKSSTLPIAVGFGIQSSQQIKQLENFCEIAVVGSHFVRIIKKFYEKDDNVRERLNKATSELLL